METKFNFKSQICTSKSQSETLLKLGLKKETADMSYQYLNQWDGWFIRPIEEDEKITHMEIPAWSLHRLMSMVYSCRAKKNGLRLAIIGYDNPFEDMIQQIEWLIEEGYFPKEYLV